MLPPFSTSASQIDVCLLRNLQNPLVGTVHIFTDQPEAVPQGETSTSAPLRDGLPASWTETEWRPPVLKGLEDKLAGAKYWNGEIRNVGYGQI